MSAVPREATGDAGAAAVIGAEGFIGRHLVRRLRSAEIQVVPLTRSRPAWVDGTLDPGLHDVQTVFHVAGAINPATAETHPEMGALEVDSFARLLDAFAASPQPPRVVLASSGGTVYATDVPPPYAEDSPAVPATVYGATKLEMERVLAHYGVSSVALRLANVYGPGQRVGTGQGVIGHWIAAALVRRPLDIYGDPGASRDYVFVDDAVEAMIAASTSFGMVPEVVNIGSGTPTSLATLAEVVRRVVARDEVAVRLNPGRSFDRSHVWLDISLAASALGWAPEVSLEDGVRRTWQAALD